MQLTALEYDTLSFIAQKSKMDCWFCLVQDKNQNDYVLDLENRKRMSIRQGVKQLVDGMTEQDWEILTREQSFAIVKLLGYCI